MAGGAEHPHQTCRDDATGIVVGDDDGVIADPAPRHPLGERLGIGERMAADGRPAFAGQPALQIDEDGSSKVAAFIGGATRAAVQVPPHVGQGDIGVSLDGGPTIRGRPQVRSSCPSPAVGFVTVSADSGDEFTERMSSSSGWS
jgi:hypothetical protein